MSEKFRVGQRVRVVRVGEIPYGQKYSYLEAVLDRTGVVQEEEGGSYVVRMDSDGSLVLLTESCLEGEGQRAE